MDKEKLIREIKEILGGINQTQCEGGRGYWETSTGAKFGAEKLKEVITAIENA